MLLQGLFGLIPGLRCRIVVWVPCWIFRQGVPRSMWRPDAVTKFFILLLAVWDRVNDSAINVTEVTECSP